MNIFMVLSLVGGLALFLYGMNVMGSGLEKLAGSKLEKIFEKLTSNPLKAVLLGTSVTAVIQSSSATTVMMVGFVNAGILKLYQAIGVIMGANIGTTVTPWILSLSGVEGDSFFIQMLKPSSFSPILAIVGVAMLSFSKKGKQKDIATIMIGFAVLMFGMDMMAAAVEPLKDNESFTNILTMFSNPLLGVIAGAIFTAIIQSSSASVGILQALTQSGALKFNAALPIILGQNIGTCVTAMLSSIGTTKNAKRVAVVHFYFNVIGTVLFLGVFYLLNSIIGFTFIDSTMSASDIAIVHTVFNLSITFILLPFIKGLEKLAYLTIKDDKDDKRTNVEDQFRLLDERFLQTPAIAIEQSRIVAANMADIARNSMVKAIQLIGNYDEVLMDEINGMETLVDMYEDKLGAYLVKLSNEDIHMKESKEVATLLQTIGDFERISDHAKNIVSVAKEKHEKEIEFSYQAHKELDVISAAVIEVMDLTVKGFSEHDLYSAYLVEPLEEVVDQLRTKLKRRHVKRLQNGQCTIELGFIYTDLLTNLERVSDHCSNVAVCLIQVNDENFETHEYLRTVKTSGEAFDSEVEKYQHKFVLPSKDAY